MEPSRFTAGWDTGFRTFRWDGPKLGPVARGSAGGWSAIANLLFAETCDHQALAVLSSFAAPLMELHQGAARSALYSLADPKKGAGLSTALQAAQTIWGQPSATTLKRELGAVARYRRIEEIGNLPVTFDGIASIDPKLRSDLIEHFINELTHSTIGLMAGAVHPGESACEGIIQATGRVAAHLQDATGRIEHGLLSNAGHAGAFYLAYVADPKVVRWISAKLPALVGEALFETHNYKLDNSARWWAAVMVAAEIVLKLGLLEFDLARIRDAATELLKGETPK